MCYYNFKWPKYTGTFASEPFPTNQRRKNTKQSRRNGNIDTTGTKGTTGRSNTINNNNRAAANNYNNKNSTMLFKNRHRLNHARTKYRYGMLYVGLKKNRYYWEVVICARKAGLFSLSVIGSANAGLAVQKSLFVKKI